jgi:peptidoglycan/LPS O-acetylase OafA/YrhL
MYVNLNPPTVALVLLGLAQTFALAALAPRLTRAIERRPALAAAVDAIGARSMSIYLWHMPALVAIALGMLWIGASFPAPLDVDWWITRPLWLAAVVAAVVPIALLAGPIEKRRFTAAEPTRTRTVAAVVLATLAVCVILLTGFAVWGAWVGAAGVTLAYGLAGGLLPFGAQLRRRADRRLRTAERAATRTRP